MNFRTYTKRTLIAASIALFSGTNAHAVTRTWVGTTSGVNTAGNWNSAVVPIAGVEADFTNVGNATPTQSAATAMRFMEFLAGAQAYTYNANGFNLTIGSGSAGSTIGSIDNLSSNKQIINMNGGVLALTGNIGNVVGGDIVINGSINPGANTNSTGAYLNLVNAGNVYFNVDSSIVAGGNVNGGDWQATSAGNRGIMYFEGTGNVYLGNLGTSYKGVMALDGNGNQNVILTHNNSLGANVSNSKLNINGGTTLNDTLQLTGGISVARWTINLESRSGAIVDDPHIENLSGNNTLAAGADWNSISNAAGNWNIQSDSGKLTIAGGNIYNTGTGVTNLRLMGAGDGEISAPLVKWQANPGLNISKEGAGNWTLSNANNLEDGNTHPYSGTTTILQGKIILSGAGSLANTPSIDIRNGAFLDVSAVGGLALNASNLQVKGAGTITGSLTAGTGHTITPGDTGIGTLTVTGNMTLNGGTVLPYELTNTPTNLSGVNDKIVVGGNLTLAGTTTLAVTQTNGNLSSGTYTLLTYGGTLSGNASNLALTGIGAGLRLIYAFDTSTANKVNLLVTGPGTPSSNLIWVGGGANPWDVVGTANWSGGSGGDNRFFSGDSVTFDNTGSNSSAINISATVSPANMTFTNLVGHNYTFTGGNIIASGNLAFNNSGNVTFSNGSISATSSVTFGGTGTVTLANSGAGLLLPATVTLNSGTLAINRTDDINAVNAFIGSGALLKQNSNTLTLSGDNLGYSGAITVATGVLKLGHANALGIGSTTVNSGADLNVDVYTANTSTVNLVGTGNVIVATPGVLQLDLTSTYSIAKNISGTGGVTAMTNNGVVSLTGSNTYSGGTTLLGGSVKLTADNQLPTAGALIYGNQTASSGILDMGVYNQQIGSLLVQVNSPTPATLAIGAGKTLTIGGGTVANAIHIGSIGGTAPTTTFNVTGSSGTLTVNDPSRNIVVSELSNTTAAAATTLDMSGLGTFSASVANIYVGRPTTSTGAASGSFATDTMLLASQNNITVAGNIVIGATNLSASPETATLRLGTTNTINAAQWVVGGGRVTGTVNFNSGLINPTVNIYGVGGIGTYTNITLGDQNNATGVGNNGGGSSPIVGTMDFTGGTVKAQIDNLTVGIGAGGTSNGRGQGNGLFKFDGATSKVEVNTLIIGSTQNNNTTINVSNPELLSSDGTVEINGGALVVNTALTIARDIDATNTSNGIQDVNGSLNLLGGTVTVGSGMVAANTTLGIHTGANSGIATASLNISAGSYTSNGDILQSAGNIVGTINLDGGALDLTGHTLGDATAITNLNLKSGTLSNVGQINNGASGLVKTTASTLILAGANTYSGDTTVTEGTLNITGSHTTGANYSVASGANLITNNVRATGALTVDGTATINANGGTAGASKVETLTINAGGKLNLKDNDLVVGTAADVIAVRAAIKTGVAGIAGITSDTAAFGVTTGFGYALGNDANIHPLPALPAGFLTGQSYDADSVLVKYTYLGDADLDGDTDLNDLGLWAGSFTGELGNPAIPVTLWTQGDFDYDGDTDLNDLGLWSSTFTGDLGGGAGSLIVVAPGASASAISALNNMGITVVPEPSTFVLAGVGLAGLAIATRRKRSA